MQRIAKALGVSEDVLTSPLPDSEVNKDSQIFVDLDEAIRNHDHGYTMRVLEYLGCKLASALHQCDLEFTDDWIEKLRTISAPIPRNLPRWQSGYKLSENDDALFSQFLTACYAFFEGKPFSSNFIVGLDKESEVGSLLRSLPVMGQRSPGNFGWNLSGTANRTLEKRTFQFCVIGASGTPTNLGLSRHDEPIGGTNRQPCAGDLATGALGALGRGGLRLDHIAWHCQACCPDMQGIDQRSWRALLGPS